MTIIYTVLATLLVVCIGGLIFTLGREEGYCDCLHDFKDEIVGKRPDKFDVAARPARIYPDWTRE